MMQQDLIVPLLMKKGIDFSSSTLSMVPGIPIKPMLAKYVCMLLYLLIYIYIYGSELILLPMGGIILRDGRITNGIPEVLKLFQNKAFTCEYK